MQLALTSSTFFIQFNFCIIFNIKFLLNKPLLYLQIIKMWKDQFFRKIMAAWWALFQKLAQIMS